MGGGTFTVTSLITPTPLSTATPAHWDRDPHRQRQHDWDRHGRGDTGAQYRRLAWPVSISVSASSLAAGANTITATYSGDANYFASPGRFR